MATLTCNRFLSASTGLELAGSEAHPGHEISGLPPFVTRSIPFEDIWFAKKPMDNSRLVRTQDPQERKVYWNSIAVLIVVVALGIAFLTPAAAGLMDGYTIQALKQEQQQLLRERSVLELDELRHLSPKRLEELARMQQFVDPGPDQLVFLDKGETVALNHARPKP
ncbi:MAG: hypothetical protein IT160_01840 [Bryobacterales bacterium]|nr:hypothetical protein [Bryobacterales bacterium]